MGDPRDWRQLEQDSGPTRQYTVEDLTRPWNLWARCAIGSAFTAVAAVLTGLGVSIAGGLGGLNLGSGAFGTGLTVALVLATLGLAAASIWFWHVFLYRMWDQAQAFTNRTSAAKAVGFLFIPFFNLYWFYVAYFHLARATNHHLGQMSEGNRFRINETLVIGAYVLLIISVLTSFLGFLVFIGFTVCSLILAFQYKAAAFAVASQGYSEAI